MKDFWKLEDFKSTKYNYITYYIIMTLVGYLYFQIYKNLDDFQKPYKLFGQLKLCGILKREEYDNDI